MYLEKIIISEKGWTALDCDETSEDDLFGLQLTRKSDDFFFFSIFIIIIVIVIHVYIDRATPHAPIDHRTSTLNSDE